MPSFASRHRFFLLALLLTTLFAALGGASFSRKVASFQGIGLSVSPAAEGTWRVDALEEPATGLEVGDRFLLLANGEPVRDAGRLVELLREEPTRDLLVLRGGALESVSYQRPPLSVDAAYLVLAGLGVLYLLIGLYTASRDSRRQAQLFYLWCLTSAALYILSPVQPAASFADKLIAVVDQLARSLLPALTLHLFLVFPAGLFQLRHQRRVIPFLYLPAAVVLTLYADLVFNRGAAFFGGLSGAKILRLEQIELLLLVLFSLASVAALLWRMAQRSSWEERRQVQWLAIGMAGGYLPFFGLYVLPRSFGIAAPTWAALAAVIALGLVPLAFAWAILKYKLLDIGLILRDTISYSLTALVGIFSFSLINLAINRSIGEEATLVRNLLTFAAGVAIAGVLVPAKDVIATGLERLQHRSLLGQRRSLRELGEELMHERDLDRLCSLLLERLGLGLDVDPVNLYLAQGGAAVPVRLEAREPRELLLDAFGEGFWQRSVASLSATAMPGELPSPEQRLYEAGYRYAFPLTVRGRQVGMVLLGYRHGGSPLNSEDVDLARTLLNQAALALENAQLLEEVHNQLEEVVRLKEDNRGIIESSPAGIAVVGEGGEVLSANHAFAAITGVERQEVTGRQLEELLGVRPLPAPGEGPIEVSYCESSGRERHLQLSVAAFHPDDGGNGRRVLVVQDVSERVLMELALQEKERLASLGMLAAGVAHEVNTPLTGISSYAQMLIAETSDDDPRFEVLKKMERQTFRAAQIVNNLLELARNRREELEPVNVAAAISECAQLLAERAAAAGVEIGWRPPRDDARVLGCDSELHQVFTNLMVNAIDAMAGSGGQLSVELESRPETLVLRFVDEGPGIPAERLERIFEPFFSSKMGKGGTGLGLAISHNIVRRHSGEIRAENRAAARGSVFTVELPRYRRAA